MISFALIFIASLFFSGIIVRVKSIAQGRRGPVILQPIYDILKLLRKGTVYSTTSGIIFKIAPTIYFSSIVMAMAVVPWGGEQGLLSFRGDFVFFAYTLALGKFFSIIGAMDTGSSFEGMGASREALFSMFAEPAFFLLLGSLGLISGSLSFVDIFSNIDMSTASSVAFAILSALVLLMICIVENSRMPVDDPKTHLELTMIHEVMILDNSGYDLGLIMMGTHLKFALYSALIGNLFVAGLPLSISIPVFFGIQIACAVSVGLIESFMARNRMGLNSQFILALTSLSLLVFFGIKFG
ncbi:MAG: NADH-quinone oxidoreductase subunit H [Bacteroidales bacterium]|nr:NADH-quinone oxidoreductase subunit H [Bacteroidales bacterium]